MTHDQYQPYAVPQLPVLVINWQKILVSVLCVGLYILFELSFVQVIQYNYAEFEKFHVGDASAVKVVLTYVVPLLFTLLLAVAPTTRLMYVILVFQLVILVYPASILSRQINADYRIFMLHATYFLVMYLISNGFRIRLRLPSIASHQRSTFLLVLAVALFIPFLVIFGPYVDVSNFLLRNIYEARAVEAALANTYTAYLYAPLSNVVLPLLLLLSLLRREYIKAMLALAMLLFMFLVGGHKSVFFGIFLLIYFSIGSYYRKVSLFLFGLGVYFVVSMAAWYWYDDIFLTSLINRRVLFLPAILDVGYFDFFDGRPLFWSESIFKHFLEFPYDLPSKNLVSEHVTGDVTSNANNGIISDGFVNLGVPGALLNIVFVSIVFSIINTLNIHHRFFGIIFLLFFTFYSSFFFTSMLTQGGLLLLIIAYLFLKDTQEDKRFD